MYQRNLMFLAAEALRGVGGLGLSAGTYYDFHATLVFCSTLWRLMFAMIAKPALVTLTLLGPGGAWVDVPRGLGLEALAPGHSKPWLQHGFEKMGWF